MTLAIAVELWGWGCPVRGLVATVAFLTHSEKEGSRILFIAIGLTGWSLLLLSVSTYSL